MITRNSSGSMSHSDGFLTLVVIFDLSSVYSVVAVAHLTFRNEICSFADFHILTSTLRLPGFSHLSSLEHTHAAATVTPPENERRSVGGHCLPSSPAPPLRSTLIRLFDEVPPRRGRIINVRSRTGSTQSCRRGLWAERSGRDVPLQASLFVSFISSSR